MPSGATAPAASRRLASHACGAARSGHRVGSRSRRPCRIFRSRAWRRPVTSAVAACGGNGLAVSRYPCPAHRRSDRHDPQRTQRDRIGGATRAALRAGQRKLTALADMRSAEGYMARVQVLADEVFLLVEHHCPICAAAMSCQGFCRIELPVFRDLLGPRLAHRTRGPSAHPRASVHLPYQPRSLMGG
jgi:hypothetical protein